jgi:hypothetical protein
MIIIITGTELHSRWMIRGRRRLLNLGALLTPPRFELPVRTASSQASDRLSLKRPSINAVQDFADRINVGTGTVGPVVVLVTGLMYISHGYLFRVRIAVLCPLSLVPDHHSLVPPASRSQSQVELRRWEHDNRVLELVLRNGKRK